MCMDFYGPYMVRYMVSKFGQPGRAILYPASINHVKYSYRIECMLKSDLS